MQGQRGNPGLLAQAQFNVGRNQAVVAAPASQSQPQMRCADAGTGQHSIAAPGQAAFKPAQGFIVQLAHGGIRQGLHLQGGNALISMVDQLWRYLCLFQCNQW